jgi:hypothetical protein
MKQSSVGSRVILECSPGEIGGSEGIVDEGGRGGCSSFNFSQTALSLQFAIVEVEVRASEAFVNWPLQTFRFALEADWLCCWVSRVVASSEPAELIETSHSTTLLVVGLIGIESAILMTESESESESESLSEETSITSGEEGRDEGEFNSVEAVEDTSQLQWSGTVTLIGYLESEEAIAGKEIMPSSSSREGPKLKGGGLVDKEEGVTVTTNLDL